MNILQLTTHLNYGGISSYCLSLSKELAVKGHNVYIGSSPGDMVPHLERSGIDYIELPIQTKSELSPRVLLSTAKLVKLIKDKQIDIIHAHTRVTQITAYYLNRLTGVPFVTTCHGFFKRNLGRQICPAWGSKVIAISEAVKKHLKIDFYLPEDRIALIPNGIDITRFRVSSRKTDLESPARIVGIIARLSSVKGHTCLIEAMAQVIKEFPEAKLYVFGEGHMKYKLIEQAEKMGMSERMLFLPSVSNTQEVLQEIDIFVMPSLQEGLGLSILEAQACGLPVIASNVGGIPTVVKNELNGLLVPPQEPNALAGAIMKVMDNKELAVKLGRHARANVEEHFNLEKMVSPIETVYEGILKK
ncbi:MAG: glycosyltransferase family 4 protein [PVC group bacterium]|nr:glycosyltransferase family 4 protein [PVC group bacterium]